MDLYARAERRDDKRGRTEAQSLPGLFGAGDGQRWLTCLGVFELAAAIQPLRGTTPAQAGIIPTAAIFSSEPKGREPAV